MNDEELAHYGIKGMRWGVRSHIPSSQVRAARARINKQSAGLDRKAAEILVTTKRGSAAREAGKKTLRDMHVDFLKNPDRVVAMRMTLGEKIAAGLLTATGAGAPAVGAAVLGQQIVSRRVQFKQETGAYDKLKK